MAVLEVKVQRIELAGRFPAFARRGARESPRPSSSYWILAVAAGDVPLEFVRVTVTEVTPVVLPVTVNGCV